MFLRKEGTRDEEQEGGIHGRMARIKNKVAKEGKNERGQIRWIRLGKEDRKERGSRVFEFLRKEKARDEEQEEGIDGKKARRKK